MRSMDSQLCVIAIDRDVVLHTILPDGTFGATPLQCASIWDNLETASSPFMFGGHLHVLSIIDNHRGFRIYRVNSPTIIVQIMSYRIVDNMYVVDNTPYMIPGKFPIKPGAWSVERHENTLFVWQKRSLICVDLQKLEVIRHIPLYMNFGDVFTTENGHVTILRSMEYMYRTSLLNGVTHIMMRDDIIGKLYNVRVFGGVVYFRMNGETPSSYRIVDATACPATIERIDEDIAQLARMRPISIGIRAKIVRPSADSDDSTCVRITDVRIGAEYDIALPDDSNVSYTIVV